MKVSKVLAFMTLLPIMTGMAHVAPADAAPAPPTQLKKIAGGQSPKVQTVHCRRYVHVHRRCVVWRGGVCRRWVRYRHRCG